MTPETVKELRKYFLKMANKKRNKDSGNNGDDNDDMNPNIKINIENILDNDLITPEYLEKLSEKFFKSANEMESKDNEDDSESSGNFSESSGNNSKSSGNNSESSRNNSKSCGNNSKSSGNNNEYCKKLVDESKELLKTIEKNDKDKKYTSADELIKKLNSRVEDDRKINEIPKKYYVEEAQRASEKVEKFNKMINDNLDMSSEKSETISRLIGLYSLRQIYYLNKIDNNLKANENIDDILINHEIYELETRLKDQKSSGMFTSQKEFAKLLTFLAQLHAGNNSKKLKNDINRLLKALYNSKQIGEVSIKKLNRRYLTYKNDKK